MSGRPGFHARLLALNLALALLPAAAYDIEQASAGDDLDVLHSRSEICAEQIGVRIDEAKASVRVKAYYLTQMV